MFISYSYDSNSHKLWVKNFATKLVENGVETMLDQWSLHPGDSLTSFMQDSISEADFVLIVCTKQYKEKSDSRIGGVGYEEAIISSDIFQRSNHRKYIPILRDLSFRKSIPLALESKLFLDFSDSQLEQDSLTDLLLTLYGQRSEGPELGSPPDFSTFGKS